MLRARRQPPCSGTVAKPSAFRHGHVASPVGSLHGRAAASAGRHRPTRARRSRHSGVPRHRPTTPSGTCWFSAFAAAISNPRTRRSRRTPRGLRIRQQPDHARESFELAPLHRFLQQRAEHCQHVVTVFGARSYRRQFQRLHVFVRDRVQTSSDRAAESDASGGSTHLDTCRSVCDGSHVRGRRRTSARTLRVWAPPCSAVGGPCCSTCRSRSSRPPQGRDLGEAERLLRSRHRVPSGSRIVMSTSQPPLRYGRNVMLIAVYSSGDGARFWCSQCSRSSERNSTRRRMRITPGNWRRPTIA